MTPTSVHHPLLKEIRRSAAAGRPLTDGLVVAEGVHLLEEALSGSWTIELILTTAAAAEQHWNLIQKASAEVLRIPSKAFAKVASTESTQEVLCLLRPKIFEWPQLLTRHALVVLLDAIQDPGNAGTIARSAEAFGATGLVFIEGSVRTSNSKFLRAAAGSIFRIPFIEHVTTAAAITGLQAANLPLLILTGKALRPLSKADLRSPVALAVGNEGAGVSPALASVGMPIGIPTRHVESLNAGVACSLALYEAHNQRVRDPSLAVG